MQTEPVFADPFSVPPRSRRWNAEVKRRVTCLCLDEWRRSSWDRLLAYLWHWAWAKRGTLREVASSQGGGIATKRNETRRDEAGVGEGRGDGEGQWHRLRRSTFSSAPALSIAR